MIKFLKHTYNVAAVIFRRAIPIATFAILFIIIFSIIDRTSTMNRPAEDYIRYTRFYVPNARESEDLHFTVCRDHKQTFNYSGNITVYIQPEPNGSGNETKVFVKEIGGFLRPGDCEDKVLLASEYNHAPGKYKMYVTTTFNEPKYHYEKTTDYSSNVYTIYPIPEDLEAKIDALEKQLEQTRRQLLEAQTGQSTIDSDMAAGRQQGGTSTPNDARTPTQGSSRPSSGNSNGGQQPQPEQPQQPQEPETREVCTATLLGFKVLCRQEPV